MFIKARNSDDYGYSHNKADHTHAYHWEGVIHALKESGGKKVFDLGCGNGAFARYLTGSIAAALEDATRRNPAELSVMGARGMSIVADRFAWEGIARQFVECYRWVLGEGEKPCSVVL